MKKILLICFIAASTFAIASTSNSKHFVITDKTVYNDTTPPMGMDTTKHKKKWDKKMSKEKMQSDTGMTMQSDSSKTAPPKK